MGLRAPETDLGPFDPAFADLPASLPVFPLSGALLLPGADLSLNIFEPRYLAMTRHVLKQESRLIGMVQPVESGAEADPDADAAPPLRAIGCAGRVTLFGETADGRYRIDLTGLIRFRVARELAADAAGFRLVAADFAPFAEDLKARPFSLPNRPGLMERLRRFLAARRAEADWEKIAAAADAEIIVILAQALPFSPDEKQALLECPDLAALAEMLATLFDFHALGAEGSPARLH